MAAAQSISVPQRGNLSLWIVLILVLGTLLIYWPVTKCEFVNYDDTDFVTANSHVQAGFTADSLKWVWTSEVARNWHPITMLTHMLDCQLFGLNAGRHHLVNLLFHIANTLLLFQLLKLLTGAVWRSAFIAALFAWHPVHVESVAWIAERKDVLSTFFWFSSMWSYVRYARGTAIKSAKNKWFYALALVLFALGLMSKPMLVTGPFVLLLLDFWPLNRMTVSKSVGKKEKITFVFPLRLLLEKIPFLGLSAVLCVITYLIQNHGGAMLTGNNLALSSRVENALMSYVRYIGKMFWPANLNGLYLRSGDWPLWMAALAGIAVVTMSIIVISQWRRRPWLALGWFWYLGVLTPVIGVVQVGMQSMADRFTYVSSIGIFLIVTWGVCEMAKAWKIPGSILGAAAVIVLTACAMATPRQIGYWRNSETFFKRMIAVNPNNYMARYNLANLYAHQKRNEEAAENYEAALAAEPNYAEAHNNYAGLLLDEKKYDEALHHYREALRLNPQNLYYVNLANALADSASARHDANQFAQAVQAFQQALALDSNSSEVHFNFGLTWDAQGKEAEAAGEFREALRLNPNYEAAHYSLAEALAHLGQLDGAIAEYRAASQLNPGRLGNYNGMGVCYAMQNKMPEAAQQFEQVIRLDPGNAAAHGNLANTLAAQNKIDEAIQHYTEALRLEPADYQTEFNLALSLSRLGKIAEAKTHYERALQINPNYEAAKRALAALPK
jgi:tetratricopeptide (TPR) repeat protein